jgi:UDP-N-acetylglucosamine 3-dehydrogenase
VSVTVPPVAHADVVVDCARAGVEAVHCEKPMADTWGASRLMAQECRRRGVQLTFNHQRRFSPRWRRAKELLDEGRIGALRRVETGCPNLYDWGTHAVDLANWYNDQRQIEWVLANVDYRTEQVLFGEHNENQALVLWEYENGVHGVASTGEVGSRAVGCLHRLVGAEGTIEVCGGGGDGPPLRLRRHGGPGWERVDVPDESFERAVGRAIADAVQSLETGEEPALSARRALDATELIFGAYESARRRGRVEFPLDVDDNPLAAMVEAGDLRPEPADEE